MMPFGLDSDSAPNADPFLSLQPNWEDVTEVLKEKSRSEVIRQQGVWPERGISVTDHLFENLPPEEKSGIGHIVGMLQKDEHILSPTLQHISPTLMETNSIEDIWTAPEPQLPLCPAASSSFAAERPTSGLSVHSAPQKVGIATKMSRDSFSLAQPSPGALSFDSDGEDSSKNFKHRPERRTAHNLIEKKYRCSINDKINELKLMLTTPDSKMSKSGILKKAIDEICRLQDQNRQLKKRNQELKAMLAGRSDLGSALHSPSSAGSSPGSETGESDESSLPSSNHSFATKPIRDRSKVTMFVFMLCMVAFNPFLIGTSSSVVAPERPIVPGGRVLHAFDTENNEEWWQDRFVRALCLWVANGLVISLVLARILMYGEPVTDAKSPSWASFRSFLDQAEAEIEKGNLCLGAFFLSQCLKVLERPLPETQLDIGASLVWQVFRHVLNKVWIGRWLSKRGRGSMKALTVMKSHGEAALLYHRLHQLHALGQVDGGSALGLSLALSALNLAEAADSSLSAQHLIEINLLAAYRAGKLPKPFRCFQGYFLRRAERLAGRNGASLGWNKAWMLSPAGKKFLAQLSCVPLEGLNSRTFSPFCSINNKASLFDHLTAALKIALLDAILQSLTGVDMEKSGSRAERLTRMKEWTSLLYKSSGHASRFDDAGEEEEDTLCLWWTNLFSCVIYWDAGEKAEAQALYHQVRSLPKPLLSDQLCLALGNAFCGLKVCSENRSQKMYEQLVWLHCVRGERALRAHKMATTPEFSQPLRERVESLALDWLLRCLGDVWRHQIPPQTGFWTLAASPMLVQSFESLLGDFRALPSSSSPAARFKGKLHEVTLRMLSGGNPLGTWAELEKCAEKGSESERRRLEHLLRLHPGF